MSNHRAFIEIIHNIDSYYRMRAKFTVKYVFSNRGGPKFHLRPEDYQRVPDKSYDVEYDNNHIVIAYDNGLEIVGRAVVNERWDMGLATNQPIMTYYKINENWAGGRIVIYNNHTMEYTVYGSGVPILSSQLGVLVDQ